MDSSIGAAARALAAGDPLSALQRVALREDPAALALRGVAMAQLGDYARARSLLKRAAKQFGHNEALFRARCLAAEAEAALAARDLEASERGLNDAIGTLDALGDVVNAQWARLVAVRRHLMVGAVGVAAQQLERLELAGAPPTLGAVAELARAEIALRLLDAGSARAALACAKTAARLSGIGALLAEVEHGEARLEKPCARMARDGSERAVTLGEVARLLESGELVLDASRHAVRAGGRVVSLRRRPVLFSLARELAARHPEDAAREALIRTVFDARTPNDSHRARLRVEVSRLRSALRELVRIESTPAGFALRPRRGRTVTLLMPPIDGQDASIVALLEDGQAWSTAALALALGLSQRTLQRALKSLEAEGKVRSAGRGRKQRWLAPPLAGFATSLLLPGLIPNR